MTPLARAVGFLVVLLGMRTLHNRFSTGRPKAAALNPSFL
jgi:hypothetical protein